MKTYITMTLVKIKRESEEFKMRKLCLMILMFVGFMLTGCGSLNFSLKETTPYVKWVEPDWGYNLSTVRKDAVGGDAEAQYQLATMYERGDSVEKDYTKAYSWFWKSAKQGFFPARYEMGVALYRGIGTPSQKEDGVITYQRAILEGFAPYANGCVAEFRGRTYAYQYCYGVR